MKNYLLINLVIVLVFQIQKSNCQTTRGLPPFQNQLRPQLLQQSLFNQWSINDVIPANYNNQQPPVFNGNPVDVTINLAILAFHKIDENQQSFVVDVFLHKKWIDRRLKFPQNADPTKKIVLNSQWLSRFWSPALNFKNARSTSLSTTINPMIYMTLSNQSEVFVAAKMSLDLNCNFDFSKYPFDAQNCKIEITSLSQTIDIVTLDWGRFDVTKNLYLPQFSVDRDFTSQERCVNSYKVGSFACIRAHFRLVRNVGNFIVSRYIPSFLIVCLCFTGFWVPTNAYPARVGLCISAILALTTLQYQNTLNVSYVYALNIWMMICTCFVFSCLIQYSFAISDWSDFTFIRKGSYAVEPVAVITNGSSRRGTVDSENSKQPKTKLQKFNKLLDSWFQATSRNNRVDMISRFFFPLSFFITTICYFCIYNS